MIDDGVTEEPLRGIRVVEITGSRVASAGRFLAELGAEVVLVEPPGGSPTRWDGPLPADRRMTFLVRNAGKRSVMLNLDDAADRSRFEHLLRSADVFIDENPEDRIRLGLDREALLNQFPGLVTIAVTEFGLSGPRSGWTGTADVQFALSTLLSQSGLPNAEPLLPPAHLGYEASAMHVAWLTMLALHQARRTGMGDYLDISLAEAMLHIVDPPYGIGGTARAGASPSSLSRGRPDAGHLYPTYRAKDGLVRICVLSPRQWDSVLEWLGRPGELSDPDLRAMTARHKRFEEISPFYERLFAGLTRAEAVEQGERFGVPVAGILTVAETLEEPAYVGTFADLPIDDGPLATIHRGLVEIDGIKAAPRPSPTVGAHNEEVFAGLADRTDPCDSRRGGELPFSGITVLDLGVIVVGAELGRLFADYGADVIKIESREFPDGSRQSAEDGSMTEGFSRGHRNKRSVGLDLRSETGKKVFRRLVSHADVVLSNFKPGTMEKLGFGHAELATINPRIVVSETSAFGAHGPWSGRMGYGPLVRASTGMSTLWQNPGMESAFGDLATVYPDHVAARVQAVAVAALLWRRERTGRGGRVSGAQVDVILDGLADRLAVASREPEAIRAEGNNRGEDAPRGVFPASGDDEWLVVDGVGDEQFAALATAIGCPEWTGDPRLADAAGRLRHAAELADVLRRWTMDREASVAAELLQAAGVPAAPMLRAPDILNDGHLAGRSALGMMKQPQHPDPLPVLLTGAQAYRLPAPLLGPAPLAGEHTRPVARELLDLSNNDMEKMMNDLVLQEDSTLSVQASEAPAVLTELHDHVLIVTINRPEARNAINAAVTIGIGEALEEAERDPAVRVVILTGAGDRAFCAGADLKEAALADRDRISDPRVREWGFAGYVRHHISKPTIAAVNGFALGGGTEIVLASDLAVAVDTAEFGLPEVSRGIIAGAGGAFRLNQQIPRKVAMEAVLTGRPITADRALEIGLVNRIVARERLLDEALELAARISAQAPLAVQSTKRIAVGITDGRVAADKEDWARTQVEIQRVLDSEDAMDGVKAFAEKRTPIWQGR